MTCASVFSFCESAHAGPLSPWHIRRLTKTGKHLGGGADTPSLCDIKVAWDVDATLSVHHLGHACRKCVGAFHAISQPQTGTAVGVSSGAEPRREKVLAALLAELAPILNATLAQRFSKHYSQAAWEDASDAITEAFRGRLTESVAFQDAMGTGDLTDHRGRVNIKGVVAAMATLRDAHQGRPTFGKLKHMVEHMTHTLEDIT